MRGFKVFLNLSILIIGSTAWGDIPKLINFQAILKDGSGNPVASSTKSVAFTIYDAPSLGSALWAETTMVTTDSQGLFAVLLGSIHPVPDSVFKDTSRYLGIAVSPDLEMSPRQRLTSVGYSYTAAGTVPVGGVVAWLKSFPSAPVLPGNFVECSGQVLSDPASIFNGQTIPDLNGVGGTRRFLRGSAASGAVGGSSSHFHSLFTAFDDIISSAFDSPGLHVVTPSTAPSFHLPDYYEVVWIMRVK